MAAMRTVAGEGISLVPQVVAHAAELFLLLRDPALYPFMDDKPPRDAEMLRKRLAKLETRVSGDGSEDWLNWVVFTPESTVAGYVQATVRRNGTAEIAYVIGTRHQRHGYGLAATQAMLGELAISYAVTEVTATVDPANAASIALLSRLGFVRLTDAATGPDVRFGLKLGG